MTPSTPIPYFVVDAFTDRPFASNPYSLVLEWAGADTSDGDKIKSFTAMFDPDPTNAVTLQTVFNRHETDLRSMGWASLKTLKNHVTKIVEAKMLAKHPNDTNKKGVSTRYYRV